MGWGRCGAEWICDLASSARDDGRYVHRACVRVDGHVSCGCVYSLLCHLSSLAPLLCSHCRRASSGHEPPLVGNLPAT